MDFVRKIRWIPTSDDECRAAEQQMLQVIRTPFKQTMVSADGHAINTIYFGVPKDTADGEEVAALDPAKPTVVLVHGFGGGVGFWNQNIDAIAERCNVIAFDLLGFGRSARPATSSISSVDAAEDWWLRSFESWRRAARINNMVLVGHSLGGYLSGVYAMRHPERVKHLVLADPWGIPHKPEETRPVSKRWRLLRSVFSAVSPFTVLKVMGPYGPDMVSKLRPDFAQRFPNAPDGVVNSYIYHLQVMRQSGSNVFTQLQIPFGWAKHPLIDRLPSLQREVPVTMLYGTRSWMDSSAGHALVEKLGTARARLRMVEGAGHHIYADNANQFNQYVIEAAHATTLPADA